MYSKLTLYENTEYWLNTRVTTHCASNINIGMSPGGSSLLEYDLEYTCMSMQADIWE